MLHRELLYPYTLLYFTVAYVDSQVQELSIPTAREWIAASMLSVTTTVTAFILLLIARQ